MASRLPITDLGRQHEALRDELQQAFDRVVGSSGFILGEEVERFEAEFAAFCGVRHCVGVASGTAALSVALAAAGVGRGDEVIVPAHTFIASALAVLHVGAEPVLCDVEPASGLIDLDSAADAVSTRTAAILPVHLYGQMCAMEDVIGFARRHGIAVIEDAAQAHGAECNGGRAGSFGTAAAYSFYPSKNLGALGDGGAICTEDADLAERARRLRDLGQRRKGDHVEVGWNERLDGLQAALLRVKLPYVERWNDARRRHAHALREALGQSTPAIRLLEERPQTPCVYYLFPIRCAERERLLQGLAEHGIAAGVHYSPALCDQPPLAAVRGVGELTAARAWASEEVSLPMFAELAPDEVARIADAVRSVAL